MGYSLPYINALCISSGGTGGHSFELPALNELCTLQGVTSGHTFSIAALNALAVGVGAAGGYVWAIQALNAISTAIGGTGNHQFDDLAWAEISTLGLASIPQSTSALFYLDGTISGNNAVDKKNGWLFPISAAPDWDTSIKIFPFRTALTISAPANGTDEATDIQAVDVNNFWYASDGTANAIPFISFFNNIDFADKCFCQPVTQTVNGTTGVEITPAGIKYIALYSTAQTASIAEMATFYGAEVQPVAGSLFVSKAGTDGAGVSGSQATPWRTLTYADTRVTEGKTVYVLGGLYVENGSGATWYLDKNVARTYKAVSYVSINSAAATAGTIAWLIQGTVNLYGFDINGLSQRANAVKLYATNTTTCNIYRCRTRLNTSDPILTASGAGVNTVTINDCVITEPNSIALYDPSNILRSYINSIVDYKTTGLYHYNKTKRLTVSTGVMCLNSESCKWNEFNCYQNGYNYTLAGNPDVLYNTFYMLYSTNPSASISMVNIGNAASTPNIQRNTFVYAGNNIPTSRDYAMIRLAACINPVVDNNKFFITGTNCVYAINVVPSAAGQGAVKFRNNLVKSNVIGFTAVSIGGQATETAKLDGSEITGNTFIGSLYDNPTVDPASTHFANISSGANIKVERNLFAYCSLALVFANYNASANIVYTSGGIGHNIFLQNKNDIVAGAIDGLMIYNNSHRFNGGMAGVATPGSRITVWKNASNIESKNCIVKNSIIQNTDATNAVGLIYFDAGAAANGCLVANNVLDQQEAGNRLMSVTTTHYTTIAAIQAASLDVDNHSIDADPLYISATNLRLQDASPAKGMGLTIGGTGLDITSDFTSLTELPTVVEATQNNDAGCFVY